MFNFLALFFYSHTMNHNTSAVPYLDASNGDFCFMPGFVVRRGMTLGQMPENGFAKRDYVQPNGTHLVIFAVEKPSVFGENEWWITLYFKESKLTDVFMQIYSPESKQMTDDEYYSSGEQRLVFHEQELKKLIARPGKMPWGRIGAYWERKSEGVGISIGYQ